MGNKGLTIVPLDLGTVTGIDKSIFTLRENQGVKVDVPCLAWVIKGGEKTLLVDTGPCDAQWAARYHRPLAKRPDQELDQALAKIGMPAGEIELVIFTHLHWDHCFNLEWLPAATFFVQQSELAYALDPLPADRKAYEAGLPGIQPPWQGIGDRLKTVEGDREVIPGVRVIHLPGHTPGSQGVVVETAQGPWVIAGDTVPLYENWDQDEDSRKIPGGIYQNLFDYEASLGRLIAVGGHVLPSHDPRVTERTLFP
ncbi:MAG: N-acyl homoserine lactonase family protein [Deltaproteobacteria bacterium]|nr:N-acyl homoserine lactonase family protein [Deltaproteobacteria bacterium]